MKTTLAALVLTALSFNSFADSINRYFKLETKERLVTIALWADSGSVGGSQYNGAPETDSAYGSIMGNVREDGLLHVTFNYSIEGSRQSEEQLIKLDGNKLIIGEGELEERGPGQMVLKDPKSVKFDGEALAEVKLDEFDVQDPKAKPVVSLVTAVLEKSAGVPVTLIGSVRVSGGWARIVGNVQVPEGKKVENEALAAKFSNQSLQAYLKQDKTGTWKIVRQGFMSDDGSIDFGAEENQEEAPWPIDEDFADN